MADAFIYDHVRTPRGRGKPDGALHEVTSLALATHALRELQRRNRLDTKLVEDVVLGCVDPVGEAGGNIARSASLAADYGDQAPGADETAVKYQAHCVTEMIPNRTELNAKPPPYRWA